MATGTLKIQTILTANGCTKVSQPKMNNFCNKFILAEKLNEFQIWQSFLFLIAFSSKPSIVILENG